MDFGGIYKYVDQDHIKHALLKQIAANDIRFVLPLFTEAWKSEFWREFGYDGATFITDTTHPSIDVFFHDYLYRVFGGDYQADYIFYKLQKILNDKKATRNFIGVRVFGSYFRIKNRIKGKHKSKSEEAEKLFLYLKDNF